jgi:ribosomal protein S14
MSEPIPLKPSQRSNFKGRGRIKCAICGKPLAKKKYIGPCREATGRITISADGRPNRRY